MCLDCQKTFRERSDRSTKDAVKLYVALRRRGVYAELEKYDGFKTIDIAVHALITGNIFTAECS